MEFNSLLFLIFFPVVTLAYHLLGKQLRNYWLLAASCVFYMVFKPIYILILLSTIAVDYYAALKIAKATGRPKKNWYIFSLVATCLILFIFKYFNFFSLQIFSIADALHLQQPWTLVNIILPIGLSFHTFQSLSYVSEVYYGRYAPEKNFFTYSLYVMFYPQLVAGPIEKPQGLLQQLNQQPKTTSTDLYEGMMLMLWGFFKKLCIADRLADFVNQVYQNPTKFSSTEIILAVLFFSIQIYCDFSAYSDIARGAARTLGYHLRINFNRPYVAQSLTDFWHRWHISLSTWFRDYLYIPLGGSRAGKTRQMINILVTFTVSGLWHGANITFVIWGFLHGLLVSIEKLIKPEGVSGLKKIAYAGFTFVVVNILWIFFRAKNISQAFQILQLSVSKFKVGIPFGTGFEKTSSLAVLPFLLMLMFWFEKKGGQSPLLHYTANKSFLFQALFLLGFLMLILMLGAFISPSTFIYFQF